MTQYQCKKCGIGAMLVNNEVVRFCNCGGPVVTNMSSMLVGKSGVSM